MSFKIFCDHVGEYPGLWSPGSQAVPLKETTPHLDGQANLIFHSRHRIERKHYFTGIMLIQCLNMVCNSIRNLQEEYMQHQEKVDVQGGNFCHLVRKGKKNFPRPSVMVVS